MARELEGCRIVPGDRVSLCDDVYGLLGRFGRFGLVINDIVSAHTPSLGQKLMLVLWDDGCLVEVSEDALKKA